MPIQFAASKAVAFARLPLTGFHIKFREADMLRWALIFFVVALVAGIMGFFGIMVAAAGIAKILFFVFLVLFLVSLVSGLMSRA
jgi:uncharacterized membrane protein YtjA (UPF0391 family)